MPLRPDAKRILFEADGCSSFGGAIIAQAPSDGRRRRKLIVVHGDGEDRRGERVKTLQYLFSLMRGITVFHA